MKLNRLCFVLLALLVLFGGCTQSEPGDSAETSASLKESATPLETDTTKNPEPSEVETQEPLPSAEPVVDAYNGSWVAPTGDTYTYTLPKLQLSGGDVEQVNNEIYALYSDNLNENGELWGYMEYSYEVYIWEDLLTLILRLDYPEDNLSDDFAIASQHYVYTLRLSDGSRVAPLEVLELVEVSQEAFYSIASQIMGNAYCLSIPEDYLQTILASETLSPEEALLTQFAHTISEENTGSCVPYLNESGELCFLGKIHQVAGAGYHTQLFSFKTVESSSPYFEILLELIKD